MLVAVAAAVLGSVVAARFLPARAGEPSPAAAEPRQLAEVRPVPAAQPA
jgi:hypothetical protein